MLGAGDTERALDYFQRSRAVYPSAQNITNEAICLYRLGRYDEALETYEVLLTQYVDRLSADDQSAVAPVVAALRAQVGSLWINANVDGVVLVDGQMRARLPLASPIHLLPGRHRILVAKDRYRAHEAEVAIEATRLRTIKVTLRLVGAGGAVRIDDPSMVGADVYIDGALLGVAPWEGTLEPGVHVLQVRKDDRGSAPQEITVRKGRTVTPALHLTRLGPPIRFVTKPADAEISVNGVTLGTGQWRGRLPFGNHSIEARLPGFVDEVIRVRVSPRTTAGVKIIQLHQDTERSQRGKSDDEPAPSTCKTGGVWLEGFGGLAFSASLNSVAESACDTQNCSKNSMALGGIVGIRGGYEFANGLSMMMVGGYLSMSKEVHRQFEVAPSVATGRVLARYEVVDELSLAAPFYAAGLGYRQVLASPLELRLNLAAGVVVSSTSLVVSGTASSAGTSAALMVDQASRAKGAALLLLPEVGLGIRYGGFSAGLALAVAALPTDGPEIEPAIGAIPGRCDPGAPSLSCASAAVIGGDGRAHGAFVAFVPTVSAGYVF
ncbi:MAG: PEGA domain-containing protein [Deltaproteobacteria bacterium]|jgi:hypothetical protein|nr:PEGA domain-containing protein [Deltaproteobacteria bacterium]MBW2537683.1 PEGA domain-containing protein [Deltaproteobacteria bacterium]